MIVINKNSINKVSTDITSYDSTVFIFKHIMTGVYTVILVNGWKDRNKRSQYFVIDDTNIDTAVPTISDIVFDQLNKNTINIYSCQGIISLDLDEGQYDVYSFYSPFYVINSIAFRAFVKENIATIEKLTNDDSFSLYLKYNANLALVK